jgi:hypothetical protein
MMKRQRKSQSSDGDSSDSSSDDSEDSEEIDEVEEETDLKVQVGFLRMQYPRKDLIKETIARFG